MQAFRVPTTGYYKLETWGAQGGSVVHTNINDGVVSYEDGAYGAYSVGITRLSSGNIIYVTVGGKGGNTISLCPNTEDNRSDRPLKNNCIGGIAGYNGGGRGGNSTHNYSAGGGGGGATHIASVEGILSKLSGYRDTSNTNSSKEILIVSAGGAGHMGNGVAPYVLFGHGGGFESATFERGAGACNSTITFEAVTIEKATQSSGYAFGRGQDGQNSIYNCGSAGGGAGAGGGWYGGKANIFTVTTANSTLPSTGGSSYINSPNLISSNSITKHMTCYSCTTSTAAATRTNSNTNVSATATADYSKTGNGYARITYLGTSI